MTTSVVLVASLVLNAVLIGAAAAFVASRGGVGYLKARLAPAPSAASPDAGMSAHWRSRVSLHERTPIGPDDVVLLGDSLTEWNDWVAMLGDARLRNRGIAGDTVAGVERRLAPILAARPRQIVLMIGINDLLGGADAPAVLAAQRALIGRIRAEAPGTALLVQSLLPVDPHAVGARHNPRIAEVNAGLAPIARDAGAAWLDLWPRLGGAAGLDRRYTYDGLHLNGDGYAVWAEALAPSLSRAD